LKASIFYESTEYKCVTSTDIKSFQITSTTTPVFIALSELCVLLKQNLIMFVQAIAYFDCLAPSCVSVLLSLYL